MDPFLENIFMLKSQKLSFFRAKQSGKFTALVVAVKKCEPTIYIYMCENES